LTATLVTSLEARLSSFRTLRVTLFGDFCLDAYWDLEPATTQLSIETGLPVREVRRQRYSLGAAGNAATALRSLGVGTVRAIGVCGADPFGRRLLEEMAVVGIDASGMVVLPPPWETLVYAKPYIGPVEESRLDFGSMGPLPERVAEELADLFDRAVQGSDAVIVNQQIRAGLYGPELIERIARTMASNPETVFLADTRDLGAVFPAACLKLNCREATAFVGQEPRDVLSDDVAMDLASTIVSITGSPVFLTRGAHGIVVATDDGVVHVLPVDTGPDVDPVGAGDVATAAIAAVLGAGGDAREAGYLANLAASVSVRVLRATGASQIFPEAVLRARGDDIVYAPGLADDPTQATFVDGTEFEVVEPSALTGRARLRHAIFDHDGTLSTLREGWEAVMAPMMVRAVLGPAFGTTGPAVVADVRREVDDLIDRTTGIQTLMQMKGLVELVRKRNFVPDADVLDEHGYKAIYNDLLLERVRWRLAKIRSGELAREDFHMKNAIPLLSAMRDAGLTLHLASGTDEADVIAEANELGFGKFFDGRIYGSIGVIDHDAKKVVIERIIRENDIDGAHIVTFGDGPVEMRQTRRQGGLAIGVCSDEVRRFGFNEAKRRRLIRGGAHLLVPDFSDLLALLRVLGSSGGTSTS